MQFAIRSGIRRSGLWLNRDFLHLWSAETISQFGSQLSLVAIPLIAALSLNSGALEMGILAASGSAPRLAIGFFAGAWVDRLRRRPIMIAMDIGRAICAGVIPIAAMLGLLSFELLLAVAVVSGCQSVFFDAAWAATVPNLVERKDLSNANGKLIASVSMAQILGPAFAGTLITLLTGPMVMWITAVTFISSGWFLTRIQKPEQEPDRTGKEASRLWQEVREGFQELLGSKVVRPLTTSSAVLNLGGSIFLSVYVLYMTNDLGLSSQGVGIVFALGGVGALIGSAIAAPLASRVGVGRTILWGAIGFGVSSVFVPFAILVPSVALPLVVISEFGAWLTLQVYNVNRFSLRQALTPDRLMGRIASSTTTIIGGTQMFGALLGGVIGQFFSVHIALLVGSVGMFIAAWWVWDSPVPKIVEMPDGPEGTTVTKSEW